MALTNIGRVGQVWQGTYDASTAYVVDDVVLGESKKTALA